MNQKTRFELTSINIQKNILSIQWTVTPKSDLFQQDRAYLSFPETLDLAALPEGMIERAVLLLLLPFFPVLAPCHVVLPFTLSDEEKETWHRLAVLQWDTMQAHIGKQDPLKLGWEMHGDLLPSDPDLDSTHGDRPATAFSGGKDSLFQVGFLRKLKRNPLLVTSVSPPPLIHHRRLWVYDKIEKRTQLDLIWVMTDFREAYHNLHPRHCGWKPAMNELNDVTLYTVSLILAGASQNIRHFYVASELEVQESAKLQDRWIQHPHAMYSAVTLKVIEKLFSPYQLHLSTLTAPLLSLQVQEFVWKLWPDLSDLQTSCWSMTEGQLMCNQCRQCLRIAICALASGGNPSAMGADLVKSLSATRAWEPSLNPPSELPGDTGRSLMHGHTLVILRRIPIGRLALHLLRLRPLGPFDPEWRHAWKNALRLRKLADGLDDGKLDTFAEEYLQLVDPSSRDELSRLIHKQYKPDPEGSPSRRLYKNTLAMIEWATEELTK